MIAANRALLVALVLVSLGLAGCARQVNTQVAQNAPALDAKFSLTSYAEEGELLALVVGTRPTITRSKLNYIPFEVGIVNRAVPLLTLSLESFTLIDEDGNRYPAVGEIELNRSYEGSVVADTVTRNGFFRIGEIEPIIAGRYTTFVRKRGVLTPATGRVDLANQFLEQFTYAVNMVYFPRPEGLENVRGEIFELFVDAPELEDPVFVRFRVPKR